MSDSDRHRLMLEFLRERPFASVRDLQTIVRVSPATIRRDIAKLHATGAVRKVFGGIATQERSLVPEGETARPFTENQMLGVAAKKAIAKEAAALVREGDAVIIHGGSTCYLFALLLANRNVKIFTNSMPLAATLWQNGSCHVTVAGGELYREPGIVFSPHAGPPEFYASKFFLGAQAIAPTGVEESHPLVVRETEILLQRADEVVVLADSRKFAMRARHVMLPFHRIGTLITDDALTDTNHKSLTDAGIRVIIASTIPEI